MSFFFLTNSTDFDLYTNKFTDTAKVIQRMETQTAVIGNPSLIISNKGSAFTYNAFKDYCEKQKVNHVIITVDLPRANGQIECLNSVITAVLSKHSHDNPEK